jgi:DNA-binding transcriptional LysR family regulator
VFRGTVSDGDLRLLRVFKAVVDNGGFAAAEVALNKSKSAISLDIANLEERFGARLCSRGRSGFALTDEGQVVYLAAIQLFTDIEKFRDRVVGATRRLTGHVRLALVDNIVSIAAGPLTRALGDFVRRHPRVELTVESASPSGVEQAVLEGEADLGISLVPRPVSTLEMIPLFREELRLYCGRGHPLFAAAARDPALVRQHPLVPPGVIEDPAFAQVLAGFPPAVVRAGTLDTRVILVLSGACLGFLPPHYAARWVAAGDLEAIMPDAFRTENTFHVLIKKSARPGAAARELLRVLLADFDTVKPVPDAD